MQPRSLPVEVLPNDLDGGSQDSPAFEALVPCNPFALDIGGSLVKIVFWERENGPHLPPWVRTDKGPEHLPLRPLSRSCSPAPLRPRAGSSGDSEGVPKPVSPIVSPLVSPSTSPAPDGSLTPRRRARFSDAGGFSVECLLFFVRVLFYENPLSLRFMCFIRVVCDS